MCHSVELYVYTFFCLFITLNLSASLCLFVCLCIYLSLFVCLSIYLYIFVCLPVCLYICLLMSVCLYTSSRLLISKGFRDKSSNWNEICLYWVFWKFLTNFDLPLSACLCLSEYVCLSNYSSFFLLRKDVKIKA